MTDQLRLFIALPLDLPVAVLELSRRLAGVGGLKVVRPENMHLTLHFLGDTPEDKLELLKYAIEATIEDWNRKHNNGPLELELKGLGAFPPRGPPRVVWVGLGGRQVPLLEELASIMDDWLYESGLGRADRPFKPHLTLARVRDKRATGPVRQLLREHGASMFGELELDRMVLFRSQLTPKGPIYTRLHEVEL